MDEKLKEAYEFLKRLMAIETDKDIRRDFYCEAKGVLYAMSYMDLISDEEHVKERDLLWDLFCQKKLKLGKRKVRI